MTFCYKTTQKLLEIFTDCKYILIQREIMICYKFCIHALCDVAKQTRSLRVGLIGFGSSSDADWRVCSTIDLSGFHSTNHFNKPAIGHKQFITPGCDCLPHLFETHGCLHMCVFRLILQHHKH